MFLSYYQERGGEQDPLISDVHYLKLPGRREQVPLISDVHYLKLPGRRRAVPSHLRCPLLETFTRKEERRSLSSQMFIT